MLTFEKKKLFRNFDFILFFTVLLLNVYGLISIYLATNGTVSFLKSQGAALVLGIVAIIFLLFIDYEIFGKLYLPIYIFSNLLLVAVLLFGVEKYGAKSWIKLGGVIIQPSEIVKIGIILSLAQFIKKNEESINDLLTIIKIGLFAGIPIALVLLQKDFGTSMVFVFFTAAMLFIARIDYKYVLYTIFTSIISLPLMWFFFFGEYQKNRIRVFLNPELDKAGSGYQVYQSKIAIGSGMKFGRFLTNEAKFAKEGYLPFPYNDFIFSVIGENFGFIGCLILLLLFFIMISRLIHIAKASKDLYGSLIVVGICAMFVFHILENIGMTIGLMPVTGIPLPFISHGGTFLLSNMVSIGLVLNVGIRKNKINF